MSGIILHEWLAATGGSENVFEVLSGIFPDAQRWCLWDDSSGRFPGVNETVLARTVLRRSKVLALPAMPLVWRHLPAAEADWVLCSSHLFAHHAKFAGPAGDAPKYVYAHTPARYIWVPELDGRGGGLSSRVASAALRPIDRRRAQEAVSIAANSRFIAKRIADTWHRESIVIYPPVDVLGFLEVANDLTDADQATLDALPKDFLLGVSRFVPYKRLDAAIKAGEASGLPVVLAGSGPDEESLRQRAAESSVPVVVLHRPSSALLKALFRAAKALVFAPIEDFSIIPVEAMASGTPVIANAVGGAAESVVDGVTGAHVYDWSRSELASAVETIDGLRAEDCVARAKRFGTDVFVDAVKEWIPRSQTE